MLTNRLPTVATLPLRWSADDAHAVLGALASSGLSPQDFSRRTGIQLQRIRRWQSQLEVSSEMVRLVEVVPRSAPERDALEVVSPGGWRLRVPPAMLGEVLRALSEGGC